MTHKNQQNRYMVKDYKPLTNAEHKKLKSISSV